MSDVVLWAVAAAAIVEAVGLVVLWLQSSRSRQEALSGRASNRRRNISNPNDLGAIVVANDPAHPHRVQVRAGFWSGR